MPISIDALPSLPLQSSQVCNRFAVAFLDTLTISHFKYRAYPIPHASCQYPNG